MPAVSLPRSSRIAVPVLGLALTALFAAHSKAADVYQPYRYPAPPPPAVIPEAEVSEELRIERRAPLPPVVEAPIADRCRVIVRHRVNEFGEPVVRRIRICDEVVRGPVPGWGAPLRRDVYGGPAYAVPPAPVPLPPGEIGPDELEEGEPG
jgi:hypothetical protein